MIRLSAVFLALLLATGLQAQEARHEIESNPCFAGSNYLAYPGPKVKALTPAPKGYTPFYISHYGRHGSRYMIDKSSYSGPLRVLERADSLGVLTPLGRSVEVRVRQLYNESLNRLGELTELGAEQHRGIARRMYERFPEVFSGDAHIDAKSTIVIRCILSMENELQEFVRLNPHLRISHDASIHDMYYMNFNDTALFHHRMTPAASRVYNHLRDSLTDGRRLCLSLFTDTTVAGGTKRFYERMFDMAVAVQNSELRYKLTLYDIFTKDELYKSWEVANAGWYIGYGASPLNDATQPYSQRNLLRNIILTADSCIKLQHPGATLRFGHETMVLPLTCLLNINGYGRHVVDPMQLERQGWINYRIFPMGANIQFVFYHKPGSEVLFKVLLNENEATLPDLKAVSGPYYKWSDFRTFFLKKIDSYRGPRG